MKSLTCILMLLPSICLCQSDFDHTVSALQDLYVMHARSADRTLIYDQ